MNLLNAFGLLNMINENLDDYQEEYKKYIEDHKARVRQFAEILKDKLPELFDNIDTEVFDELIREHDDSKYSEEEFEAYAQRFYNNGEEGFEFEQAWKHHWTHNEHHPEFWLGEDMPLIYILEMLCDWGSFAIDKNDLSELSKYYYSKARDDEEKDLSDNTKIIIEEILEKFNSVISEASLEESLTEDNSYIFNTDFLYHATFKPYWEAIQEDGFISAGKHCNWQGLSKPTVVCLARDPDVAVSYCEANEEVPEEFLDQIVVLQIEVNKLNLDLLNIDENVFYTYDDDVDPELPATWQEFQYEGKIPLSFISNIEEVE